MQLSRQAATRIWEKASRKTSKDLFVEEKNERRKNVKTLLQFTKQAQRLKSVERRRAFPPLLVQQGAQHNGTSRRETKGRSKSFASLLQCIPCNGTRYQVLQDNQDQATRFYSILSSIMKSYYEALQSLSSASTSSFIRIMNQDGGGHCLIFTRSQRQTVALKDGIMHQTFMCAHECRTRV